MNKGFRKRDRQIFSLRRLSRILICALALEQREVASSRCSWITCSRPGSIFSFFLCNMIDKGSLFEKEKREMWTHRAEPHNPTRICESHSISENLQQSGVKIVRKSKNEIQVAGGVEEEGQGLSKDQFQQVRRRSKGIDLSLSSCILLFISLFLSVSALTQSSQMKLPRTA